MSAESGTSELDITRPPSGRFASEVLFRTLKNMDVFVRAYLGEAVSFDEASPCPAERHCACRRNGRDCLQSIHGGSETNLWRESSRLYCQGVVCRALFSR